MTTLAAALAALLYLALTGVPPRPLAITGHALAWPVMLPRLILAWARQNF